jgi:RNA polymerase sigma-70 factor, ECF subfamily
MSHSARRSDPVASSIVDEALVGLVERAKSGDRAAFTALFEQHNARICAYLARVLGDDDLARDLAQDTFLTAWRSLSEIRDPERFTAWLYRIATNLAHSHRRRARIVRWLPWPERTERQARDLPAIEGPEAQTGEAERVKLALATLSMQCRACVLLQLEGGFAQREIAEMLGISESSVGAYVSRGRERFRQAYQRLESDLDLSTKGGQTQ